MSNSNGLFEINGSVVVGLVKERLNQNCVILLRDRKTKCDLIIGYQCWEEKKKDKSWALYNCILLSTSLLLTTSQTWKPQLDMVKVRLRLSFWGLLCPMLTLMNLCCEDQVLPLWSSPKAAFTSVLYLFFPNQVLAKLYSDLSNEH